MVTTDWREFDTLLLDMDGTVLDLAFDNHFWRELVPRYLAARRSEPLEATRLEVFERYAGKEGQLEWYCIDYWSAELDLDLRMLKSISAHRIRYLPGARDFLRASVSARKRIVLVTNAHRYTLGVKRAVTGLDAYFERTVSAHDIGFAKEQADFWPRLQDELGFDAQKTLFVDDSLPVLDTAHQFGVAATLAVRWPDTRSEARVTGRHAAIDGLVDLLRA